MLRLTQAFLVSAWLLACQALAHSDPALEGEWWAHWTPSTLILVSLGTLTSGYVAGLLRIRKDSKGTRADHRWRTVAFFGAVVTLVVALLSPVDTYSDHLGWVHMVQHTLIMMVAAPLFIAGMPARTIFWVLPAPWRRRLWRMRRVSAGWHLWRYRLTPPLLAWVLFALTLWLWHVPALYQWALVDPVVHDVQHVAFFLSACAFWSVLLNPLRNRRLGPGTGIVYLFVTSLHSAALGALMALSPIVLYPAYGARAIAYGLSPLEDQQLAGYIMWMPGGMMYAVVALTLLASRIRNGS